MLLIAFGRFNLLFQNIDFPFQLSPQHAGIGKGGSLGLYGFIQLFNLGLNLLVFNFDFFVLGTGLLQIAACNLILLGQVGELFLEPSVFQQEHIDV